VPLALFVDFAKEDLAAFLSSDVQAVIFAERTDCEALKERYPDRLTVIPSAEAAGALVASDLCMVGDMRQLVPQCLAAATLPVVSAALGEDVVDVEDTLASGTGIVLAASNAGDSADGMSRVIAAFHRRDAFFALARRLPGYAVTWPRVAETLETLVEEVRTENRYNGK